MGPGLGREWQVPSLVSGPTCPKESPVLPPQWLWGNPSSAALLLPVLAFDTALLSALI